MQKVAKFYKVSEKQFIADMTEEFPKIHQWLSPTEERLHDMYEDIKLPKRATKGSAGYDFYAPFGFTLNPGETIKIPTGIRVSMREDWFLAILPRSGLGFKYRMQLDNTVGIIDSDYFKSDNEGHIMIKITNDSKQEKSISIVEGMAFAQGIF